MKIRSFTAKIAIIIIMCFSFIHSYTSINSISVYADDTTNQWTTVTTNQELAEAFRYYCKSRNLTIEGSVLDALTTFTTNNFNTICNTLGIDITALQAHLKRSTDSNGKVQFLFDQFGVTAYNRIFAEFLQNNNLAVGDSADEQNNTVYSGYVFTDDDGNSCLVYFFAGNGGNELDSSSIVFGTPYKDIRGQEFYVGWKDSANTSKSFTLTKNNRTYNIPFVYVNWSYWNYWYLNANDNMSRSIYAVKDASTVLYDGVCAIIYDTSRNSNNFYIGVVGKEYNNSGVYKGYYVFSYQNIDMSVNDVQATTIYYTTNNNTINNNTYNDNSQTVINNEGDVYNYNYDNEDPPVNPPSGGGGDTTNVNIDFPNFDFNIPDIDFSLDGLTEKFPFCIPFDMVALLQLLNTEPQAPRIQGQIPFGSFFTWNLDLDFSRFNDFAVIMRGLEFVGFIFFLIGATINIAKG